MSRIPQIIHTEFSALWKLSLLSFVIAGLTGFLYRFGFLMPLPEWLHLGNIRHAHSHLMFFNWITPPILIWMAAEVIRADDKQSIRKIKQCIYLMMILGFLTWPFFLLFGYQSITIDSANLPVAAMLSGLVMITWYWFGILYYRARQGMKSALLTVVLFDGALAALVVSSLGAWGVSVYQLSSLESPLISKALTSFFLGVFTEGWVILGLLGILWSGVKSAELNIKESWYWKPVLFGSLLIFPFSLDQSIITPLMLYSAKAGLLLIVVGLSINLFGFLRSSFVASGIGRAILLLLGLKILFQAGALLPTGIWPGEHGLRIFYLHLILLGFGSTGLIVAFHPDTKTAAKWSYVASMTAVLITLGMFSGYWPRTFIPEHLVYWLAGAALLPVLPVAWLLADSKTWHF